MRSCLGFVLDNPALRAQSRAGLRAKAVTPRNRVPGRLFGTLVDHSDGRRRCSCVRGPPQIGLVMSEASGCCCWAHSEGTGGGGTVKDKYACRGSWRNLRETNHGDESTQLSHGSGGDGGLGRERTTRNSGGQVRPRP